MGIYCESSNKRKINSNNVLKNLKNKYTLVKIFDNILKKKLLDIIKYNKKIQKRINININEYIKYSEIYSSIEIEVILINNKDGKLLILKKKMKNIIIYILIME